MIRSGQIIGCSYPMQCQVQCQELFYEFRTILYRYAQFKGIDVSKGETAYLNDYTDARDISEWAVKAFRWAVDAGVIQGMTATTLSPKRDAARAQVATMLMRFDSLS